MVAKHERAKRITKIVVPDNYDVDALRQKMSAMPPKAPPLKAREIVQDIKKEIEQMLARQYDWVDIADVIKGTGLIIAPTTLRQYAGASIRKTSKQAAEKSANKAKLDPAVDPVNKARTQVAKSQTSLDNKIDKAFKPSSKKNGPAPDIDFGI